MNSHWRALRHTERYGGGGTRAALFLAENGRVAPAVVTQHGPGSHQQDENFPRRTVFHRRFGDVEARPSLKTAAATESAQSALVKCRVRKRNCFSRSNVCATGLGRPAVERLKPRLSAPRAQATQKVRAVKRGLEDTGALAEARVKARGGRRRPRGRRQRRMRLPGDRRATGFTMVDCVSRSDVWRRWNRARRAAEARHRRVASPRRERGSADVFVRSIPRQACTW